MGFNMENKINSKTAKCLYYTLKALATAIAIANISCSIYTFGQVHTRIFKTSSENEIRNVTTYENHKNGTNFSGGIAALVTNMLLVIGIFSDIDLFLYIWLFIYGSFWLVFIFVSPEAYHKLPGISHYFTRMISERYHLDERDRPRVYTCLKLISCLARLLLLYVRKNNPVHRCKEKRTVGTQMPNKSRIHGPSSKEKAILDDSALSERTNIYSLQEQKPCYNSTPTFKRNSTQVPSRTNASFSASTDTLIYSYTSTPSFVILKETSTIRSKSKSLRNFYNMNESKECSFDILQSTLEN